MTACNKSPSVNVPMTSYDDSRSHDQTQHDDLPSLDAPITIELEGCSAITMQEGYDPNSTDAIVQAVVDNDGKHTLSLDGRSLNCKNSKNDM